MKAAMNVRIVENEKQMLEAMKDGMETIWVKGDYADKAFDSVSKAEGVVKQALEALEDNLTTGKQPFPSDVIIGIGVEMLTRRQGNAKPSPVVRRVVSFFSGVTAGLFGIDLFFLAYLERVTGNREEFRSNVCFVFLFECIFRAFLYLWNGLFSRESLLLSALAIPAAFAGMSIGSLLDKKVSDRLSRKFIIYVFILGGISTVIYAAVQIW